jgi:6-pyruvoyl-tetrahydropterin synthase
MLDDINEQTHIDLSCVKEMKKMFISEMDDSFLKQNLPTSKSAYQDIPKISIT